MTTSPSTLPSVLDAERSVVGGILLHPKAFARVADQVKAADFYHPAHGAIFAAMVALDEAHKPIDAIHVAEQMRADDTLHKLRAMNGEAYFAELTSAVVTVENIEWQARLIASKARRRRVIETAQEVAAAGYGEGDDESFIDDAEAAFFAATQSGQGKGYEHADKIMRRVIKAIEQRYDRQQAITGVPSGYQRIDAMTQGWQPSDLIILAARPSMGKTSLVMNAVFNAAIEFRIPALVFSLEMSKEQLIERMVSTDARIDSTRLRGGFLEQRDWINLTKTASLIAGAPIDIDDASDPTILDIRARARRWRADNPGELAIVVVDYLQLINTQRERGENESTAVGRVSRGLKGLAKELRVPVIALSQLSRAVEDRKDKRPGLHDLRESGAIEQDADVVAFIYRDEVYKANTDDKGIAEIIIGKHRNGPLGTVRLRFLAEYTRFENIASQE